MSVLSELKTSGVVAAIKDEIGFRRALNAKTSVLFMLKSDLLTAAEQVRRAHAAGKKILLHIDLMDGIGRDEAAVRYIAEKIEPDGVITTRPALVKCAKNAGLFTVFRVFLIDSQGLESAIANAEKLSPDAVEIMPGLLPDMVDKFSGAGRPVIVGGLICSAEEVRRGLKAGALAASTSDPELWDYAK